MSGLFCVTHAIGSSVSVVEMPKHGVVLVRHLVRQLALVVQEQAFSWVFPLSLVSPLSLLFLHSKDL